MDKKNKNGCRCSKSQRKHKSGAPLVDAFPNAIEYFNKSDARKYQLNDAELLALYQMKEASNKSKLTLESLDNTMAIMKQFAKVQTTPARVLPNIKFSDQFREIIDEVIKEEVKANPDLSAGLSKKAFNDILKTL